MREFQAQGKEQQTDANLCQQFNGMNFFDGQAAGVRAKDNACEDVSKNERLLQPLHQQAAEKGGENQEDNIGGYAHEFARWQS